MIRAKFRCNTVAFRGDPTDENTPRSYELTAVYDTSTPEHARFTKSTPWAEIKMNIDNPSARLVPGKLYYVDFHEEHEAQNYAGVHATPDEAATGYVSELPDAATHHPATGTYTEHVVPTTAGVASATTE